MDNKTTGEQLAQTVTQLSTLFLKLKSEKEATLTPDQKKEYEKLSKEHGIDKAMVELKDKMEQFKDKIMNSQQT